MRHFLKTLPEYFELVKCEAKNFEVRKNDRDFKIGDELILREWDKERGFTGNQVTRTIGYILPGGQFGIEKDYVVIGFLVTGVVINF